MTEDILVNYDIVTEMAGHQSNTGVKLAEAAKDIFRHVKEKAMQVAVNGAFKTFESVDELEGILVEAVKNKFSIRCYDEDYQG